MIVFQVKSGKSSLQNNGFVAFGAYLMTYLYFLFLSAYFIFIFSFSGDSSSDKIARLIKMFGGLSKE